MDFNTFKEAVIAQCQALGITDYELFYQSSDSTSVSAFQHEINEFDSSVGGGACFRCLIDGHMGYASTEALSEETAAMVVAHAAENAKSLETDEPEFLGEGNQTYAELTMETRESPSTDALIQAVLDTQEKMYAADPAVIDGSSTNGVALKMETAIYNSRGLDLHYENRVSGLVAVAVVTNGQEMSNDYQIRLRNLSEVDTDEMVKNAVNGAKSKLGGDVAPTGNYPVIFAPDAMADLLATFSGIFSSEVAQKGLCKLGDKEGQVIASEIVTLMDDPFYKDNPLPLPFDAEGTPTYSKAVIKDGVLQTLLYNLKTAAVAGRKTTGNASKAGYSAPVRISPFTMYVAPGAYTEEELLQKAGNGVYINSLSGLHAGADTVSGDFSLQSSGFMIENGQKTVAVKSFTVAGNFYDLLKQITAIANNCTLPSATDSTAFASPSVLVEGLSIAGK